nr:hypothetical protein [Tanacetum cinerariifolium]
MVEISSLTKTRRFKSLRQATNGIPTSRVMWEVEPCERQRHMIIELDYPLLETNEAILFSKLTIGVCESKQEEALKWEPHDKIEYTLSENGSRFPTNGIPTSRVMWEVEPRKRHMHMIIKTNNKKERKSYSTRFY